MILLAGGSGTLGTWVVPLLTDRGQRVRVLTRDRARAEHLESAGVEIVEGDVREPADLVAAVAGVDTVVSAVHGFVGPGSPATVDRDGNANLMTAASTVGARFVLVSVVGAAPDSPMVLFRAKFAAEERLRHSDLVWTIVRSTAFMETWATVLGAKGRTLVFGRGRNPINFVSAGDVAALIEHAVFDAGLDGQIIELGGPDNLTLNEFAAILNVVTGRLAPIRHIPRPMLRFVANVTSKLNPTFARQARAAVVMDTRDMTFDASATRRAFPDLPATDVTTALKRRAERG